jgi:predicted ATPase
VKRHILTGAPGSGKTAILRMLESRGHCVVEEAATDVIALQIALGVAEPHRDPTFIDQILDLQIRRRAAAPSGAAAQFHDRSPVCVYALALWLGHAVSRRLEDELAAIRSEGIYENTVFFIRNLGFVTPTQARRISFAESLEFETLHEQVYRSLGFALEMVDAAPLGERVDRIEAAIGRLSAAADAVAYPRSSSET